MQSCFVDCGICRRCSRRVPLKKHVGILIDSRRRNRQFVVPILVKACREAFVASQDSSVQDARKDLQNHANLFYFQLAILKLKEYWATRGCLIWSPHNSEVGAGTMNPATFLRVLGPEPWRVAYEEPSIRPDDSRYGDNPNRVQRHTQFQVILKPAPEDSQELFLNSLRALGVDVEAHDIRFVEDNWESPALGAWGLGWEVWLDGLEITQFTYFQQAGGFSLDPISLEITYGLERIMMSLQNVSHFKEIQYNDLFSYGDLLLQNEYEMSRFYLDEADISRHKTLLQLYEEECRHLLKKQLPIAAYEFVLKASHTFNILDARGAVGVTERAKMFQRIRSMACDVASAWLETRKSRHFPLLQRAKNNVGSKESSHLEHLENSILDSYTTAVNSTNKDYDYFVLEIGTEELPKDAIHLAQLHCKEEFAKLLVSNRISWRGNMVIGVTPRRIVLMIPELATSQSPENRKLKGPPAKIAYKESGEPTEALLGFCRTQGISVSSVTVEHDGKSEYIFGRKYEKGVSTVEIMTQVLPQFLESFTFARTMKWNETLVSFPRPIRWLLAMLGQETIRFRYAGLEASNCSFGLRAPIKSTPFVLKNAKNYLSTLDKEGIMLETSQRRKFIWEQASAIALGLNGSLLSSDKGQEGDECLLQEVSCLVESPVVSFGRFDESFLSLPREVLTTVMRKHQRYFPVQSTSNSEELLPVFIFVTQTRKNVELVRKGNESVLKARYTDAEFFYEHDLKQSFDTFRQKLGGLTFQERLGSMLDKTLRLERLVSALEDQMQLTTEETRNLQVAAGLCKADLASSMVIEFTSLAGVMGKYYALEKDYPPAVALAIEEHYLPRYSGDKLPSSKVGAQLGIIDRVDSLVGLFAAGCTPRANADPFGLRRIALGLVQICILHEMNVNLRYYFQAAARLQPIDVPNEVVDQALGFVMKRLETWLIEDESTLAIANHETDVIQAVLSAQTDGKPFQVVNTLKMLMKEREKDHFEVALQAYARPAKLLLSAVSRDSSDIPEIPDPTLFETEEEKRLYYAISKYYEATRQCSNDNLSDILETLAQWKPFIDAFFDNVFVMSPEKHIRYNRLALCRMITKITTGVIDLAKLRAF
ncbi:hypothetical protein GAYE_SCF04G2521 [Galdieria yellowstonensis]|uniref:glycine--tRNA ligase n=1 Tax=Galdieria yellowstonensis TaxID=3028027 RepID=A0AAV9IB18_9RHOD|nr:hypothetical protein GAYE_SCF04G2521 [Galdieria yellowstonensis]